MAAPPKSGGPPGAAVDSHGGAVIDPTANVIALNEAATKRQDDLREKSEKSSDRQLKNLRREVLMHVSYAKELASAESRRVDEQAELRAQYAAQLADAESKRIDAIRLVDVNAVLVAANRASDQASVLATNVASSAEALRTLVATTAAAFNANLQQMFAPVATRLTTLEQAQYQNVGKQSYADPAFIELLTEVKQLRETTRQNAGKGEGIGQSWGVFLGAAGLLLAIGMGAVAFTKNAPTPASPQIVVVPAPASPTTITTTKP